MIVHMIGLKRCTTCKGVEKNLQAAGLEYSYREIDKVPPRLEELHDWKNRFGLPITRFFNTSGAKYRQLGLAKKRKEMSDNEQIELLATDGMLVKRPILFLDDRFFIGPDAVKAAKALAAGEAV